MNCDLKRIDGETQDQYFYRICNMKDSLGFTWPQMAEIFNQEFGCDKGDTAYRKEWNAFSRILNANMDKLIGKNKYLDNIKEAKRELEKERKKLQTEKLEYSKWLREEARDEMIRDAIIEEIRKNYQFESPTTVFYEDSMRVACLCLADPHYGVYFKILGLHGEVLNEYSPEIFEERMEELFNRVVNIIEKEHIEVLHIYSLGDELDGILRVSQLMKLKYGVVESAIRYADYMSTWLNALSKHVYIKFQAVKGNHTELRMLGQPKGTFKDDNAALFINEIIKTRLEKNLNFEMIENPTGLIFDNICGFNLLGIHGEVKDLTSAIKDFSNTYNTMIDILIGGHTHHLNEETVGINKDVISVPSIIGIDDFSMKLNRTSNPGATMFFVEEGRGVVQEYRIKL